MFENVRRDYLTHGRSLRNRALWALVLYRFGRWALARRFAPLRWAGGKIYGAVGVFAPVLTGVAIDRHMTVGEGFHIVHPGMIVIHPRVSFGDRCGVMHSITIGVAPGADGVPKIGNDVFIGTGAVVIGAITVGDGARIAANSLVVCDVPPGALAIGVPAKIYPGQATKKG
jgi:serine O-acetyltransferase